MAVDRFRSRRIELFINLFNPGKETKILDVGGTSETWLKTGLIKNVTLLNLTKPKKRDLGLGFQCVQADAVNMNIIDNQSFDIVFSNSVIEHVGGGSQENFADEIRRVGSSYWIQTPNKYFPVEPHLMFPFAQFLPSKPQQWIAHYWPNSNYRKWGVEKNRIGQLLEDTHLLSENELSKLFPEATIHKEKVAGLTKSLIVWKI